MIDHSIIIRHVSLIRSIDMNNFFQEWGENCPDFDAAYKMENDMTFTPYERIEKRANEEQIIDKILKINSSQLSIGFM